MGLAVFKTTKFTPLSGHSCELGPLLGTEIDNIRKLSNTMGNPSDHVRKPLLLQWKTKVTWYCLHNNVLENGGMCAALV